MKSNLTLSVGWVEIWRLRLISTQVVVDVGVELGKTFDNK